MAQPARFIVVMVYDKTEDGSFVPAFAPMQFEDSPRVLRTARKLSMEHDQVIAWAREIDANTGQYGPPIMVVQSGVEGRTDDE